MGAAEQIDRMIAGLKDWRGELMAEIRDSILKADPEVLEEWKWMGTPVWNHAGIVCLANPHKEWVKITFHKGASLKDPEKLFNAGLEGGVWRAINIKQGERLNRKAFQSLYLSGVALNLSKEKKTAKKKAKSKKAPRR